MNYFTRTDRTPVPVTLELQYASRISDNAINEYLGTMKYVHFIEQLIQHGIRILKERTYGECKGEHVELNKEEILKDEYLDDLLWENVEFQSIYWDLRGQFLVADEYSEEPLDGFDYQHKHAIHKFCDAVIIQGYSAFHKIIFSDVYKEIEAEEIDLSPGSASDYQEPQNEVAA